MKVCRDLIKSAKAATMKALEEYQKRQRQLHELRLTMKHVMAVGNDVILCPIDLFSEATGKSCCYQSVDMIFVNKESAVYLNCI